MKVFLNVRKAQHYKRDDLILGLQILGHKIVPTQEDLPQDETGLLVTWNLTSCETLATNLRQKGGKVIVVENPYVKFDREGNEYLAMARDGHNGSGTTPTGGPERLDKLGVDFFPWKEGQHLLIADQRGIGSKQMRSPQDWGQRKAAQLKGYTNRAVSLRPHPGRISANTKMRPLEQELQGAHALIIWASNCATQALISGIPVFYDAPHITLEQAAKRGTIELEKPFKGDRIPAFIKLSWSQWSLPEIRNGEAYERLLECKSTPLPINSPHTSVRA